MTSEGAHRQRLFILAGGAVLSTFFFFFFLAAPRHVAVAVGRVLIVFGIMVVVTAIFALFGYLKVRRIRGPQETIKTVKEIPEALTPGHDKAKALSSSDGKAAANPTADPSGW